jgi:hypothetical protein
MLTSTATGYTASVHAQQQRAAMKVFFLSWSGRFSFYFFRYYSRTFPCKVTKNCRNTHTKARGISQKP